MMHEHYPTDYKFYALFVIEFPEYEYLHNELTTAIREGDVKKERLTVHKLFHLLRVNGWG